MTGRLSRWPCDPPWPASAGGRREYRSQGTGRDSSLTVDL